MLNRLKYKRLPRTLRERWSYEDFLFYRMQEMNVAQIENIATGEELWDREKELNKDDFRDIFNDKKEFYKRFHTGTNGKYIRREIVFLEDIDRADFEAFCNRYERIVLKPKNMYAGIGVRIIAFTDGIERNLCRDEIPTRAMSTEDLPTEETHTEVMSAKETPIVERLHFECLEREKLYDEFERLKEEELVAEEYVFQAKEYADIYPKSLNTLRVTTFVGEDGKARVLFAVNQFGQKGSAVDNDDEAAIWAVIDSGNGIVYRPEVEARNGLVYDIHPDTGAKILGFVNLQWTAVRKLALELALEVPECRLVGWDIAIAADGVPELIEGNVTPELELYQNISGQGLKAELGIRSRTEYT